MGVISAVNTELLLNGYDIKDLAGDVAGFDVPESIERYMIEFTQDGGMVAFDTGVTGGPIGIVCAPTSPSAVDLWREYVGDLEPGSTMLWNGTMTNNDSGAKLKCINGIMGEAPPFWNFAKERVSSPRFVITFAKLEPDFASWSGLSFRTEVSDGSPGIRTRS